MEQLNNWREEMRSAYLYAVMAKSDNNPLHKKLFLNLQQAAKKQAGLWADKINITPSTQPLVFVPDTRTRIVAWLITWLGVHYMKPILSAMKIRGMSVLSHDDHSEHRHTSLKSSSNLRAAVFGVNDGLISNMGLVLGVAAANSSREFILLAGIAGLLAGACSMAAGEYISVRTQREVFEYQIAIEKQELAEYPQEEMEELSMIYQARNIPKLEADKLAKLMIDNPETALHTLAREELGLNPEDLVSPYGAMVSSFISFALGAVIPLVPFLLGKYTHNLVISMVLTAVSLFVIGTIMSLFSNRNPFLLGARMLGIGAVAGTLTFLIGKAIGVSL